MATTEVSDILTISECLEEANVYGVKVPGNVSLLCETLGDILSSHLAYHFILDFKFKFNAGHEGRIGMAAVTVKVGTRFNGGKLYNHVLNYLPSYARPRFIRMQVTDLSNTQCNSP